MIKEKWEDLTIRSIVTRICDHCGKEERKSIAELRTSLSRIKLGKDYCKKCAYIYRHSGVKSGAENSQWTGGVSLNMANGYLRINKTGQYLHKKILEDSIGRKITVTEKVHHIDMNKINNDVDNLFICSNKRTHHHIHTKMEYLGYSLLGEYVWFDRKNGIYTTEKVDNHKIDFVSDKKPSCVSTWKNGKKYSYVYLGHKKHTGEHRYVYSKYLGRDVKLSEHIHHINGDTLDNDINNLILLDRDKHKDCHNSIQKCICELYASGIVKFNKQIGEYNV